MRSRVREGFLSEIPRPFLSGSAAIYAADIAARFHAAGIPAAGIAARGAAADKLRSLQV
jgi:hypothetical protein